MSTISATTRLSVADMRQINPGKPVALTGEELEDFKRGNGIKSEAEIEEIRKGAQAQTEAVKVHTVYRKGDKIIGVQFRDGSTTFVSNSDSDHRFDAEREGRAKGLKGDALTDYIGNRMAETLKKEYGYIRVERYAAGNAPTQKQISEEMFGTSGRDGPVATSRVNLTPDTLELLSGS